jgi:hypothetical protein
LRDSDGENGLEAPSAHRQRTVIRDTGEAEPRWMTKNGNLTA